MSRDIRKGRTFESFVVPEFVDIRKKYEAVVSPEKEKGWPRPHVEIYRNEEDGSKVKVYEYERGYSFYNTFEPFQQLRDGVWKDYALISSEYTRFEVVDLEKGEVIAVEAYPTISQSVHDGWDERLSPEEASKQKEKQPVGSPIPGAGFCPVDFHVPTLREKLKEWIDEKEDGSEPTQEEFIEVLENGYQFSEGDFKYYINEKDLLLFTGQYAFYCGCVWGDDDSWKLNWIDLSRIHEGIVTADSKRYGYVPLFFKQGERLKDIIKISDEGFLRVPMMISGHVSSPGFWEERPNWRKQ